MSIASYTKILTNSGWSEATRVNIDSTILSERDKQQRISCIGVQATSQPFVRITFEDGRTIDCSEDSRFEVYYYEWATPRIMDTLELKRLLGLKSKATRLYIELYTPDFGRTTDVELPIDPYILGCLIGDGCLTASVATLTTADPEMVAEISARLGEFVIRKQESSKYSYGIIDPAKSSIRTAKGYYNNRFMIYLYILGLDGHRANSKFVPAIYLLASASQRLDMLRGLMDTDGTATTHGSLSFCTVSKQLAEDVQYLVRSLGGLCKITTKIPHYTYKGERKAGQLAYICHLRMRRPTDVFLLERKKARTENYQYADVLKLRVNKVENIDPQKGVVMMTSGVEHEMFVVESFVPICCDFGLENKLDIPISGDQTEIDQQVGWQELFRAYQSDKENYYTEHPMTDGTRTRISASTRRTWESKTVEQRDTWIKNRTASMRKSKVSRAAKTLQPSSDSEQIA